MIHQPVIKKVVSGGGGTDTWNRPSDWLAIPSIGASEEVIYLLMRVENAIGNYCAFKFSGAYSVDWGDGSAVENVATNTKAEHSYSWDDCGNTTSEGFRQALIKITPQGGNNITAVNLQEPHSTVGIGRSSQIIDMVLSIPNVAGAYLAIGGTVNVIHRLVQRVYIVNVGAITKLDLKFASMQSLQNVPLFDTSSVNSMRQAFYNCSSLRVVPLFDTSAVTDIFQAFYECNALASLPAFDFSLVTDMTQTFYGARSLLYFEANASSVIYIAQLFQYVSTIQKISLTGLKKSFSIASTLLSAAAINALGNSVADLTGFASQSVTVTGAVGAGSMDASIFTNKNWTVVN